MSIYLECIHTSKSHVLMKLQHLGDDYNTPRKRYETIAVEHHPPYLPHKD